MSDAARDARRGSLGGSDARIIMSGNQSAIEELWAQKRGEAPDTDLSDVLLVQLGNITEAINADWFEKETGLFVTNEQDKVHYAEWEFAHTTLDGIVRSARDLTAPSRGIVEFKYMLPFNFTKEGAVEKYFPQLQHNMMVTGVKHAWISIITGAGGYYLAEVDADIFYQMKLLDELKKFWDCVQTGRLPGVPEVVIPQIERVKKIDMTGDNQWGDLAATLIGTKTYAERHEKAKKDIKKMFPNDAQEASGYGVKISLSKDGKTLINLDKKEIEKFDNDNGLAPAVEAKETKPKAPRKKAAAKATEEAA
jgi:predicted phage-related endonuclease